ncbi:FAD-binding oxidoreductase [Halobacteria archaeon AArc-curdl1]|uniref:FAD-binding oxidoreductase n=1 Tax=Natronosalvus hydrolyticus TaxID=2979988 RepID=A0AAP2Z6A2_9EURY|nr:FAD-binding oxidoreductase [Halobacteria archaeon AArc-curdl1]
MTADLMLAESAYKTLEDDIHGEVLRPCGEGYDEAREVWNAMIEKHPAVITRCAGTADVIAAVNFARENGLPIGVKGNGHNVAGNAVCDNGLTIDLSGMTAIRVDPMTQTARVEPGATLADVDHETQAFGLATPLGFVSETGIAGLTLGGGFGYLSRTYGMTVDNLRSVDIVTADGELLHANENEHSDLFWAVRGGGGNFGIVTSFEFDLHEVGPEILAGLIIHRGADAHAAVRHWRDYVADVPDELTVWVVVLTAPPAPFIPEDHHGEPVVAVLPVYAGVPDEGWLLVEPFLEFGDPLGDNVAVRSYAKWQQFFDDANAPGARNYWKSLNFTEFTDEMIDTVLEYGLSRPTDDTKVALAHMGGAMSRTPVDATAYPHRDAEFLVNIQVRWDDQEQDEECVRWADKSYDALVGHSTDGTYMNFISEGTGQEQFAYRGNYDRLVEVKTEYDPENVFQLNQNVTPATY